MNVRPDSGMPDQNEIEELRARADAGDKNAGGRLGEVLAAAGDKEEALRVWGRTYGESASGTKRLAELMAEDGDLERAVQVWEFSDALWFNPEGHHQRYLDTLSMEDRLEETYLDPEDWAFMELERLTAHLLARGDEAAIAELRARAADGDPVAAKAVRELPRPDPA